VTLASSKSLVGLYCYFFSTGSGACSFPLFAVGLKVGVGSNPLGLILNPPSSSSSQPPPGPLLDLLEPFFDSSGLTPWNWPCFCFMPNEEYSRFTPFGTGLLDIWRCLKSGSLEML